MKVIIGVEDRIYGEAIIQFIAKQNWKANTNFELIHVIDDSPTGEQISQICCSKAQEIFDAEKQAAEALLMDFDLQLVKAVPDAVTEQKLLTGRTKEKLLQEIEEQNADMLIVGSHGRTGFKRFLLGSVSVALLSHAPCSVLIVKLPKESLEPTTSSDARESEQLVKA